MTHLDFSFDYKQNPSLDVHVETSKKLHITHNELHDRIKAAALTSISAKHEGPLSLKISDTSIQRKEANGHWTKIALPSLADNEEAKLTRVLGESVSLKSLEETTSPLGRFFHELGVKLSNLFYFITGRKPSPEVNITLLQDAIGAFPKSAHISLVQALEYWEKILSTQKAPTEENAKLIQELKECQQLTSEMESLEWIMEGSSFDSTFAKLIDKTASKIEHLKEGERLLLPAGFWTGALQLHDCLLEVSKSTTGYTVKVFSINEDIAKRSVMYVQEDVPLDEIKNKIPWIITLRLPQMALPSLPKLFEGTSGFVKASSFLAKKLLYWGIRKVFRTSSGYNSLLVKNTLSDWKNIPIESKKSEIPDHVQQVLPRKFFEKNLEKNSLGFGFTAKEFMGLLEFPNAKKVELHPKESLGKPSDFPRAEGITRVIVRSHFQNERQNYKVIRISGEVDLLLKATKNDSWLKDPEYRDTVSQSALRLLADLEGIRKEASLGTRIVGTSTQATKALEDIEKALFSIRERAEKYSTHLASQAAHEALKKQPAEDIVAKILTPGDKAVQVSSSDTPIDLHVLSLSPVNTTNVEETKKHLQQYADLCSTLASRGEYVTLLHALSIITLNIPLLNNDGTFAFGTIPSQDAKEMNRSIDAIHQAACWCSLLGSNPQQPSIDAISSILSLEAITHQLTEQEVGKKLPWAMTKNEKNYFLKKNKKLNNQDIMLGTLLEEIHTHPLSNTRSLAIDKRFQDLHTINILLSSRNTKKYASKKDPLYIQDPFLSFEKQCKLGTFVCMGLSEKRRDLYEKFSQRDARITRTPIIGEICRMALEYFHQRRATNVINSFLKKYQGKGAPCRLTIEDSIEPFIQEQIEPLGLAIKEFRPPFRETFGKSMLGEDFQQMAYDDAKPFPRKDATIEEMGIHFNQGEKHQDYVDEFDPITILKENRLEPLQNEFEYIYHILKAKQQPFTGPAKASTFSTSLTAEELIDLKTLCSTPTHNGYLGFIIASMNTFAEKHPNLLTMPELELLINRTLFRNDVWNQDRIVCHQKGIHSLLTTLSTLEEEYKSDRKMIDDIRITSLIARICHRASCVPKAIPESLKSRNWIQELSSVSLSEEAKYLANEETISLLHEKYLTVPPLTPYPSLKDPLFQEDMKTFMKAWLFINNKVGNNRDVDPGLRKIGQRLLIYAQEAFKKDPQLTFALLQNAIKNIFSEYSPTTIQKLQFPTAILGEYSVNLIDGRVFKNGTGIRPLPLSIQNSKELAVVGGSPQGALWNYSRTIHGKDQTAVMETYTKEDQSDIRIIVHRNPQGGIKEFSIQKNIKGIWFQCTQPNYKEKSSSLSFIERKISSIFSTPSTPPEDQMTMTVDVPKNLQALIAAQFVWVEATNKPTKMISLDGKAELFLSSGKLKKVLYNGEVISFLGEKATEFFKPLDDQIIGSEKKIIYTRSHIRNPQNPTRNLLTATRFKDHFEFEGFSGFICKGASSPEQKKSQHPIIPPGISHFHTLEKKAEDKTVQKVLIPMRTLAPVWEGIIRGAENVSKKQFSRFQTQVTPKDEAPGEDIAIAVFDVDAEKGKLISKDPVANAYLAYMYATQQRDADAIYYLNKCRTGVTPSKELSDMLQKILEWNDESEAGKTLRLKVLLQKSNWSSIDNQQIELIDSIKKLLATSNNKKELYGILSRLDEGEKRALLFIIRGYFKDTPLMHELSQNMLAMLQIPDTGSIAQALHIHDASAITEHLLKTTLPPKELDPKAFMLKISTNPDVVLEEQFLSILKCIHSPNIRAFVHNSLPKTPMGLELKALLLTENPPPLPSSNCFLTEKEKLEFQQKTKNPKSNAARASLLALIESLQNNQTQPKNLLEDILPPNIPIENPFLATKNELITALTQEQDSRLINSPPPPEQFQKPSSSPTSLWNALGIKVPFDSNWFTEGGVDAQEKINTFFNGFSEKSKSDLPLDRVKGYTEAAANLRKKRTIIKINDPQKTTEELQTIKKALQETQKSLVTKETELKNSLLNLLNPVPASTREKFKQILTPETPFITLERLLGSYVKGETELLLREFGRTIEPYDVEPLFEQFLDISIARQHIEKTLIDFPSDKDSVTEDDLESLAASLKAERYYDPKGPSGRKLHVLEYVNGYLLRPKNIKLANDLLENKNCIKQLPPGSGKTEVVLRLISILQADGYHVPCLILPEWLIGTQRKEVDQGVQELIGQNTCCIEVPEGKDLSPQELEMLLIKLEKTICDKGVVISTRKDMLGLKNLFNHYGNLIAETRDEKAFSQYKTLGKILHLLKERGRAVCDEVDSLTNIHEEVNRKSDAGVEIEEWKRETGVELFSLLLKAASGPLHVLAQAILTNTQVDLPKQNLKEGMRAWAQAFCEKNNPKKEDFEEYLISGKGTPPFPAEKTQSIVAAKEFLAKALPLSTLQKAMGVKGGYGKHADPTKVGPYKGPKTPDPLSEYCDEFELLAFTMQDYIQTGITEEQTTNFLRQEYASIEKEWKEARRKGSKSRIDELPRAVGLCSFFGLDFDILFQEDKSLAVQAFAKRLATGEQRLEFCKRFILPELRKSNRQERSSAFDLVDLFKQFSGVTGTPYNLLTYHDKISKEDAILPESDGETISAIMRKSIQKKLLTIAPGHSAQEAVISESKKYDGIIDIGAYCRDTDPEVLAQKMAETLPDDLNFVVFIDKEGKTKACGKPFIEKGVPRAGAIVDFDPNNEAMSPDKRKTLFQVFIGANIKQKPNATFLVTVGNKMFLKDFIQGVMRLRRLPQGQTFDIALSPEVAKTILKVVDKEDPNEITIQDIIAYCLDNEEKAMKQDVLAAEKQKIARYPQQAFFEARVAYAASASPDDRVIANMHLDPDLKKFISPVVTKSVENLSQPIVERPTKDVINELYQNSLDDLRKIKTNGHVQRMNESSIFEAEEDLLHKRPITPNLPPTDKTGSAFELGKTAMAQQQVTTTTTTTTTTVQTTRSLTEGTPRFPTHMSLYGGNFASRQYHPSSEDQLLHTMKTQQKPESEKLIQEFVDSSLKPFEKHEDLKWANIDAAVFDTDFFVSNNILQGIPISLLKEIQHLVFFCKNGKPQLFVLDNMDFQNFMERAPYLKSEEIYPVEYGLSAHALTKDIPKSAKKAYSRFLIQVKLFRGDVLFDENESIVLKEFIREKGAENIKKFVTNNTYMTATNKLLFEKGTCPLATLLTSV